MRIGLAPKDFDRWQELHHLLVTCFAFMEGRIDPPSSLAGMTPASLARKAADEVLVIAQDGARLVGCGYLEPRAAEVYLSKLAVHPDRRRRGILRGIVAEAERLARERGLAGLHLQTRVELVENHGTFAALGFVRAGEYRHPGYDRTTSLHFRRPVAPVRGPCPRGGSAAGP